MSIDDTTPPPGPIASDADGCWPEFPPGWAEYQEARRRALRQMGAGGRTAGDAGRAPDYALSAAPG